MWWQWLPVTEGVDVLPPRLVMKGTGFFFLLVLSVSICLWWLTELGPGSCLCLGVFRLCLWC